MDAGKLLTEAVALLRLHVAGHVYKPNCNWDGGKPCYNCRTVKFLGDNFPKNTKTTGGQTG